MEAFNAFHSELMGETCPQLRTNAGKFKDAVDTTDPPNGFKQLAGEFQEKASEISTNKLSDNDEAKAAINVFKAAAKKFGNKEDIDDTETVAGKLSTFATALNTKAAGNECYKLLMHADKFAKAATLFSTEAKAFQAAASAFKAKAITFGTNTGANAWTFREAATSFYDAVTYLKDFAVGLSNTLAGTELEKEANDFKTQVHAFYNDSRLFYYSAQQVTKDSGLNGIAGKFKVAADAFQKAAEQFYKDNGGKQDAGTVAKTFEAFNAQLQSEASGNCTQRLTKFYPSSV